MNSFLANDAILAIEADRQKGSRLFDRTPPEVRACIWEYALTDYPDTSPFQMFDLTSNYTRPGYDGPPRTDTALLRTCRAIYKECWFLPFFLHEHVEWFNFDIRCNPPNVDKPWHKGYKTRMSRRLLREAAARGKKLQPLEINHMHFFAESTNFEHSLIARRLRPLVRLMHPRTLTITVRARDWKAWKMSGPPELSGRWISSAAEMMPDSVREVRLELEALAGKDDPVRELVAEMMEKWFLVREDGSLFFPGQVEEARWRGPSLRDDYRQLLEETSSGVVNYVMLAVRFQLETVLDANKMRISEYAKGLSQRRSVCPCKMMLQSSTKWPLELGPSEERLAEVEHFVAQAFPRWTQPWEEIPPPKMGDVGERQHVPDCQDGPDYNYLRRSSSGRTSTFDMSALDGELKKIPVRR